MVFLGVVWHQGDDRSVTCESFCFFPNTSLNLTPALTASAVETRELWFASTFTIPSLRTATLGTNSHFG